jgi:hypothetical protein
MVNGENLGFSRFFHGKHRFTMFYPFYPHVLTIFSPHFCPPSESQQPFNLASSGAKVIGQAPSKPPVLWNSWDPRLSLKMDEKWMKIG